MSKCLRSVGLAALTLLTGFMAHADENLFGAVKGVETLPEGSWEIYEVLKDRSDKGTGHYEAIDSTTEFEYGVTNRFSVTAGIKAMSLDTHDIRIDGYLPEDKEFGMRFAGVEVAAKYNFLSPALAPVGLSGYWELDYMTLDPHSGQDKTTISAEGMLLLQKYFLEGQLIWVGNLGLESTYADRERIDNLPEGFEWPTDPEMELEVMVGSGLSYRFAPRWFFGAEAVYETEFETEVGQERWSVFAGPNLHYAAPRWWATLSWLEQVDGGGELIFDTDDLHLIEKTERELVFKLGVNL